MVMRSNLSNSRKFGFMENEYELLSSKFMYGAYKLIDRKGLQGLKDLNKNSMWTEQLKKKRELRVQL